MAEEVINLKPVSCTASTLTTPATTAGVLEALKKPVKETSAGDMSRCAATASSTWQLQPADGSVVPALPPDQT